MLLRLERRKGGCRPTHCHGGAIEKEADAREREFPEIERGQSPVGEREKIIGREKGAAKERSRPGRGIAVCMRGGAERGRCVKG